MSGEDRWGCGYGWKEYPEPKQKFPVKPPALSEDILIEDDLGNSKGVKVNFVREGGVNGNGPDGLWLIGTVAGWNEEDYDWIGQGDTDGDGDYGEENGSQRSDSDYPERQNLQFLIFAILKRKEDLAIEIFSEGSIDVEYKCGKGWTLLMYAASVASPSLVSLLIDSGSFVPIQDAEGNSCLTVVGSRNNDFEDICKTIDILCENGADLNSKTKRKWQPIMFAVHDENVELLRYFLAKGAYPNDMNEDDETALMMAAKMGSGPLVSVLLEFGAQQTHLTEDGLMAHEIAHFCGHAQLGMLMYEFLNRDYVVGTPCDLLEQMNQILAPKAIEPPEEEEEPEAPKTHSHHKIMGEDGVERTQIELFLNHLHLNKYSKVLNASGIPFSQFLCSTSKDLLELGVRSFGHRIKILDGIRAVHNMEWKPTSLVKIHDKTSITTPDTTAVLANFVDHMDYMASTFKYLTQHREEDLKERGESAEDVELTPQELVFAEQLDVAQETIHRLRHHLRDFAEFLFTIKGRTEFRLADEIVMEEERGRKEIVADLLFCGILVIGIGFGFMPDIVLNSFVPRQILKVTPKPEDIYNF